MENLERDTVVVTNIKQTNQMQPLESACDGNAVDRKTDNASVQVDQTANDIICRVKESSSINKYAVFKLSHLWIRLDYGLDLIHLVHVLLLAAIWWREHG